MANKGKIIPAITFFGGMLLFMTGFNYITYIIQINDLLSDLNWTFQDLGSDPSLLYVRTTATIIFGVGGIIGGSIITKKPALGSIICLVLGIIATIGLFLPIGNFTLDFPSPYNQYDRTLLITLNGSLIFIDPILLIIGGILGLVYRNEVVMKYV